LVFIVEQYLVGIDIVISAVVLSCHSVATVADLGVMHKQPPFFPFHYLPLSLPLVPLFPSLPLEVGTH